MRPEPGVIENVASGIQLLLAPNPGPMTYWGTNTYLVGESSVAIVDPGPDDSRHFEALMQSLKGRTVSCILVTHAHTDHSALAAHLGAHTRAPIFGFGPPDRGRSATMQRLAATGEVGGGEGVDFTFRPDTLVGEGDFISGNDWKMTVRHTPGHFSGHLAFDLDGILLSGDHAMEWSSSIISPPDGNLADYMEVTRRLIGMSPSRLLTGHGGPINDPVERLTWLITHREARDRQILEVLAPTPQSLESIAQRVYRGTPLALMPAAERNVLAHLIDQCDRGICVASPQIGMTALFSRGPAY